MFGVTVNAISIVIGSLLGILLKKWITPAIERAIQRGLGFCTLIVGIKMALRFEHVLLVILCVVVGGIVGTLLNIDENMERLGDKLKRLIESPDSDGKFSTGFSLCSILFCTGAMAIVGSIESSLYQNHETIFTKSMMDGIFAGPMAAIYGIGVAFSALSVFIYQGIIALAAKHVVIWTNPTVMNDISGVGGILVAMIGAKVSHLTDISLGAYFPAILLALIFAPFFC